MKSLRILLLSGAVAMFLGQPLHLLASVGPSPEALRQTIRDYVSTEESRKGAFKVFDSKMGVSRSLQLERVHERVGKTGDYYYSCADLKDVESGDLLDVDFDIQDDAGKLSVVDIRIHKDNGKPRFTYDENDNIVPLT